jgi:protein-disulfide isomerase
MSDLKVPVGPEDHVQGDKNARLTLVEYGDFECPHCGMAYPIVKQIQEEFGDELRFVYRHFPLTQIHRMAEPAAEATESAAAQGRFWEMHDAILENNDALDPDTLVSTAEELGLDGEAVESAMEEQKYTERIQRDVDSGMESGVHGTPTFFINGHRHQGSFAYEDLVEAISARRRAA